MYCSIRGSQAWNSNDSRIAKRMALLVFTDFACWAPITFFSLTAAFGLELISLSDAKIFTIFVLPLNSCANPFLYAIFTKQFKRDCAVICKKIEESSLHRSMSRMSNRNSVSWGSSRRISALNSFFNGSDKKNSGSNQPRSDDTFEFLSTLDHKCNRCKARLTITNAHMKQPLDSSRAVACVSNGRIKGKKGSNKHVHHCACLHNSPSNTGYVGAVPHLLSLFRRQIRNLSGAKNKECHFEGKEDRLTGVPLLTMGGSPGSARKHSASTGKKPSALLTVPYSAIRTGTSRQRKHHNLVKDTCEDQANQALDEMKELLYNNNHEYMNVTEDVLQNLRQLQSGLPADNGIEGRSEPEGSESNTSDCNVVKSIIKQPTNGCTRKTICVSPMDDLYSDNDLTSDSLPSEYIPVGEESNSSKICPERFSGYSQVPSTLRRCKADLRRASSMENPSSLTISPSLSLKKSSAVSSSLPLVSGDTSGVKLQTKVLQNTKCKNVAFSDQPLVNNSVF